LYELGRLDSKNGDSTKIWASDRLVAVLSLFAIVYAAMPTTKMIRQWDRWAGTITDLEHATQLAIDTVGQRSRTEPPCQIEIAFPQRVTNAESPDALETEIDTRDLALIQSIRILVGAKRGLRATIHLERNSPALTVEVVGEDRTRVEGLTSQLEELLRRGKQRPASNNSVGGLGLFLCLSIAIFGVIAWSALEPRDAEGIQTPAEAVALFLTLAGALSSFFVVLWLLPALQLLKPGEQSRWRRFRVAVIAFVGSLITSVIASVLYEAVR
jgi:hypothetical protein